MPRIKKDYSQEEFVPGADYEWFESMAVERGLGSVMALSEAVVSGEGIGNKDLLGRTLRRKRRLKVVELVRLAEVLRVPVNVVLNKLGYNVADPRAEVRGRVNGDGLVLWYPKLKELIRAPEYMRNLAALRVDSEGSPLAPWHDCLFFYVPKTDVSPESDKQLSVIKIEELPTPILGFARGAHIETLGSKAKVPTAKVVWSSPIRWISFP